MKKPPKRRQRRRMLYRKLTRLLKHWEVLRKIHVTTAVTRALEITKEVECQVLEAPPSLVPF
jgi:hypothetical protein